MKINQYAEGSRRDGEISLSEAASLIGIHRTTLRAWYLAREAKERSRLPDDVRTRVDMCSRLWFAAVDVERFLASAKPTN